MFFKLIFLTFLLNSATCRTAKNYREMPDTARLSQADFPQYNIIAPNGPGTYAFGYEIEDAATKNVQFRDEERLPNGTVRGSYGVLFADDTLQITKYIADQFGYRANTETKKKSNSSPLKIELQLQPTTREQPGYLASSPSPIRGQTQEYPFAHPITPTSSYPNFVDTMSPTIDPILAAQVFQQHQINLNPTFNPLRDPNILEPQIANAILSQQYYVPQNPFLNPALRQSYDGTVSTYTSQNQQPPWNFPFLNWLTGNNNNNNYYQNQYQDQVQTNRPVIDFFTNLANNNPITNFLNSWGQNDNPNTPVQNFFNNLNPLNIFNNNRPPQTSLPVTAPQSDYIPSSAITQQSGTTFMQPSNNIDNSVFSNDHFLNPNTFYPNTPNNPQLVHSYYPQNQMLNQQHYPQTYSAYHQPYHNHNQNHHRYPYNYYNPYNPYNNHMQYMSPALTYNRKKTNSKRKKNKNKVDLESDSDWFQDFLDKRKEASLDLKTRRKTSSKDSDDDDDINLDEYFR